MSAGFYKRCREILKDIEAHVIHLRQAAIHDFFCLKANLMKGNEFPTPAGVVSTSAAAIHAYCTGVSMRTLQRDMNHMEKVNWIKFSPWRKPGQRGNFMVVIGHVSVHDLSGKEFRINTDKTVDWRHPVYEPVGEVTGNCRPSVGEVSGYREEREEIREERERPKPAAKTAPPADPRCQPFIEFAYKAFADHFGQKPSWHGKDWKQLKILLAATDVPLEEMQARWRHYLASTEPFTVKKGGSLAYFCANFDAFINGPLLAPEKGRSHGKLTGDDLTRANLKAAGFDVN
jgi:hypothetical protein